MKSMVRSTHDAMKSFYPYIILLLGVIYATTTTAFFGSNYLPGSPAECITDGITLLISSIGLLALSMGRNEK